MTKRRYTYLDFTREPVTGLFNKTTHAVGTGLNTVESYTRIGEQRSYMEIYYTGNSTLIFPTASAAGWLLPIDNAGVSEGVQLTQGMVAGTPTTMKFVTGTDSFFIKVRLTQTVLADYVVNMIGFRELGAYATCSTAANALTAYDSKAMIGINDAVGTVVANTSINTADTVTAATSTPLVTAVPVTWEIRVAANRAITFYVDGVADVLLNAAGLLAEAAQTWVPTIIGSTAAAGGGGGGNITIQFYECGLL